MPRRVSPFPSMRDLALLHEAGITEEDAFAKAYFELEIKFEIPGQRLDPVLLDYLNKLNEKNPDHPAVWLLKTLRTWDSAVRERSRKIRDREVGCNVPLPLTESELSCQAEDELNDQINRYLKEFTVSYERRLVGPHCYEYGLHPRHSNRLFEFRLVEAVMILSDMGKLDFLTQCPVCARWNSQRRRCDLYCQPTITGRNCAAESGLVPQIAEKRKAKRKEKREQDKQSDQQSKDQAALGC